MLSGLCEIVNIPILAFIPEDEAAAQLSRSGSRADRISVESRPVTPAKAGVQGPRGRETKPRPWMLASAGMTEKMFSANRSANGYSRPAGCRSAKSGCSMMFPCDRRNPCDRARIGGREMARAIRRSGMRRVPLSELKDDLSRFLREAEHEEIVITRRGKPVGC